MKAKKISRFELAPALIEIYTIIDKSCKLGHVMSLAAFLNIFMPLCCDCTTMKLSADMTHVSSSHFQNYPEEETGKTDFVGVTLTQVAFSWHIKKDC
jgi:hypothetical protein